MKIRGKKFRGVYEIESKTHKDDRGFISHTYRAELLMEKGLNTVWAMEYHSYTDRKRTIRGLYVQLPPYSEGKLITALVGEMKWIFLDLREGSETFGQWDSVTLSGTARNSIYLPRGFANGCISLSDHCNLLLKADNHYSEAHGVGIVWDDAELNIDWGLDGKRPIISEAHKQYRTFKEFKQAYGKIAV